ncbi:LacI family DNA-binding transcriptional regulator [Novosphingobium flavum]|uniref:LacI family DNA-binding transcriptional regulator n=1 Tax=Novosphingobium flavum TaxID=1778672 RepID=A0A7X1FR07_9SPHN|nr:LacI family DNA-binding transcriptional regulator [Novosphingobium flavum]
MRDVSRLANVSRMTVSRALNDPETVRPDTRARVLQAVADLGYVPDRAAGSLASRRSGFIGLVLPTLTNVNFASVAHGLTSALRAKGFQVLIAYSEYRQSEAEAQIRNLLSHRPEAIIVTGEVYSPAARSLLLRADVPVIEIADDPARAIQHAIGVSNHAVGRFVARHLIEKGFTRLGAISSMPQGDLVDHRGGARCNGFEDELRAHGLPTDMIMRTGAAPFSYELGASAISQLLDSHPEVEAVFCVSDLPAVGALMECQRRGISVPRDLSLIGFGDFDIGRVTNPALTTVQVDFLELGRRTGQLVLELLGGADETARMVELGFNLVERGSVGVPRSGPLGS